MPSEALIIIRVICHFAFFVIYSIESCRLLRANMLVMVKEAAKWSNSGFFNWFIFTLTEALLWDFIFVPDS